MKGILTYYYATGESGRPQFIGYNSLDSNHKVCNYQEVYDIEEGDQVRILNSNFTDMVVPVSPATYTFLAYLTAGWRGKSELEAQFVPHSSHKSWGEISEGYTKKSKKSVASNSKKKRRKNVR